MTVAAPTADAASARLAMQRILTAAWLAVIAGVAVQLLVIAIRTWFGAAIQAAGGNVVAAACIVDRSAGEADVGVPLIALASLKVPAYPADALPPELAAIPIEDPGSRRLSAKT